MTIIQPDPLVGIKKNGEATPESKEQAIPTDPEGIKKYLDVIPKPVGYRRKTIPPKNPEWISDLATPTCLS